MWFHQNNNIEITLENWNPDYFATVNQIEPIISSNASLNWNKLANSTIDQWIAQLHQLDKGVEKQAKIDRVVKAILGEQVVAAYFQQSAEHHCLGIVNFYVNFFRGDFLSRNNEEPIKKINCYNSTP